MSLQAIHPPMAQGMVSGPRKWARDGPANRSRSQGRATIASARGPELDMASAEELAKPLLPLHPDEQSHARPANANRRGIIAEKVRHRNTVVLHLGITPKFNIQRRHMQYACARLSAEGCGRTGHGRYKLLGELRKATGVHDVTTGSAAVRPARSHPGPLAPRGPGMR